VPIKERPDARADLEPEYDFHHQRDHREAEGQEDAEEKDLDRGLKRSQVFDDARRDQRVARIASTIIEPKSPAEISA